MNFFKTFLAGVLAFLVGSFLFFFLLFSIGAGIAGSFEKSAASVENNSILKIDLSEVITDAPSTDPLAGFDFATMETTPYLSLYKVLQAIDAAKTDDRIAGIYLRLNGAGGIDGTGVLEELRGAIKEFKEESGKFVVAYNETYTQGKYYLASVADKIYMQPEGGIDWMGMATNLMFYKELFDKLDLHAEVFRPTACKYKSAVEPYILDKMSPANREQMQALINSLWGTISGEVAAARGIDSIRLMRLTDSLALALPEDALKNHFVDSLIYEDQMKTVFSKLGVKANKDKDYNYISLGDYASQMTPDSKKLSADKIAIVYASGEILDGEGSGDKIYGNSLAKVLADVRGDDKIKAVVMRVNSPGGSALASDLIWREMQLLKAKKPVIVSMGSYAASGGYYISCPADVVVADKMTLTGSIGVFGMYLYTPDALKNKLGITLDGVKSNTSADMGQLAPLTPLERATIMRGVDKVYTTFTSHVSKGRNLPIDKVLDIAGGRVWSGVDALKIGLIDSYGGLKTAIAIAADKAGLGDKFRVVEQIEQPTGLAAVIAQLNVKARASFVESRLEGLMSTYKTVQEATSRQGIQMYSPYKIELK